MSHPTKSGAAFYNKYFGQLVGATITGFELAEDPGDDYYVWPRFKATLRDGTEVVLEISQDEEGNGPGFIFGLPSVVVNDVR